MNKHRKKYLIYGGVVVVAFLVFLIIRSLGGGRTADGLLHLYILDVGQGDAALIVTPSGKQVLIDSGPDRSVIGQLHDVMPAGDKTLDMTIATHPDMDHIGGFVDVLRRYEVTNLIDNGVAKSTPEARAWRNAEQDEVHSLGGASQVGQMYRGDSFVTLDGIRFQILHPDKSHPHAETNDNSINIRLDYGAVSVLFTGDSSIETEMDMIEHVPEALLDVDILKVAHHGSQYSSSLAFLRRTSPWLALISVACDNDYGHPHPQTLKRYQYFRIPVMTTCKQGTIEIVSDGKTFWVEK